MRVYYLAGIPYSDEIYHFGIKGQKWGIRRYQNEDGTLTKEGKQRYRVKTVSEYERRMLDSAGKTANELQNITRNTSDIIRKKKQKESSKVTDDVKKMSDEELRKRINRIQLERQYSLLTSSDRTSGKEKALEILETTGSVVAVAGGIIGIAAGVKNLMPDK